MLAKKMPRIIGIEHYMCVRENAPLFGDLSPILQVRGPNITATNSNLLLQIMNKSPTLPVFFKKQNNFY